MKEKNIILVPLVTLPQLLDVAETENLIAQSAIKSYREFLGNPLNWQLQRGLAIPADSAKKAIETASANLRNSLKGTDIEDIKKKTQDLVQASMKLGEAIYKSQQSAKPGDTPKDAKEKEEGKKDDNVVDADFEEVKDDNKEKSA